MTPRTVLFVNGRGQEKANKLITISCTRSVSRALVVPFYRNIIRIMRAEPRGYYSASLALVNQKTSVELKLG